MPSSTLSPDADPTVTARPAGTDNDALGPSDSSDSGSDVRGDPATAGERESDSDRQGTGERATAVPDHIRDGADIAPDHLVDGPDAPEPSERDA